MRSDMEFWKEIRRQVLTARNIRPGWVTDYLFGALSCQIEHHLFPAMPRYSLRKAEVIVREFCRENGIPYHETGIGLAYWEVGRQLRWAVATNGS